MIDDAKIRLLILKALPALEPWRVEMEEIDFGDVYGVALKLSDGMRRLRADARGKSEEEIAADLTQQIKAVWPAARRKISLKT